MFFTAEVSVAPPQDLVMLETPGCKDAPPDTTFSDACLHCGRGIWTVMRDDNTFPVDSLLCPKCLGAARIRGVCATCWGRAHPELEVTGSSLM